MTQACLQVNDLQSDRYEIIDARDSAPNGAATLLQPAKRMYR